MQPAAVEWSLVVATSDQILLASMSQAPNAGLCSRKACTTQAECEPGHCPAGKIKRQEECNAAKLG